MSERGVFALDRGWFDHPSFADEPFTEREAWAWLIAEAAFKDRTKRIGSLVLKLDRGQVAASLRFMADKWKWSEPRVRRFLKRLKTDAMIDAATDAGITLITLCNYTKYQRVSLPRDAATDAPNDAAATQQRRKEEDTEDIELADAEEPRARTSLISPEAQQLADELLVIAGHDLKFVPPGWCGAAMRVQTWLADWPREIILSAVTAAANRKRGPPANRLEYFEPAVAEEFARQKTPLPTVEVRESQTVVAYGTAQNRSGSSLLSALDRRIAEAELAENADPSLSADSVLRIPDRSIRRS